MYYFKFGNWLKVIGVNVLTKSLNKIISINTSHDIQSKCDEELKGTL